MDQEWNKLEEVVDLEDVITQAAPEFAAYVYYENDQCTGFIKSMFSVKLNSCMKVKGQKVSFTFSVGSADGIATVYQQVYSDARCKKAYGSTNAVFQAPFGCNSAGGLYATVCYYNLQCLYISVWCVMFVDLVHSAQGAHGPAY